MKSAPAANKKTLPAEPGCRLAIRTADGEFAAAYSDTGLCRLEFPLSKEGRRVPGLTAAVPPRIRRWHARVTRALLEALQGRKPKTLPPLDLSLGTRFQRQVWQGMRRIPPGRTKSYGELASAIGRPRAVRALGGACGANPIPIFVPCHRVVAAHGKLGGFSGGLKWKRLLLAREGSPLST